MVTDGILRAVNMMMEHSSEPEHKKAIDSVWNMLGDFDEDEWFEMSDDEKEAWVKKFALKGPEIEKGASGKKGTINREKLKTYVVEDMILQFDSPEECMNYFKVYDYQKFQSVEEMKTYQGKYGFGLDGKWYHVNFDEALDVWENGEFSKDNPVIEYRDYSIYEKDGDFTVGSIHNEGFEDCTLENFEIGDEHEMAKWCMEHGDNVIFKDLRDDNKRVSYDDYLKHLDRYTKENGVCIDNEFIVPCVRFSSIEKAKEFLNWVDERFKGKETLVEKIHAASVGQKDKTKDSVSSRTQPLNSR